MTDSLLQMGEGFWNVRGSFKLAGLLDIGTQASLVRLHSGDFVLLDSYKLTGDVAREVLALTDQGRAVRAILNLHPFHTAHVAASAEQFPNAALYGTSRHKARAPGLRWQALHTDDAALHALFAEDFSFTVPRGVDFIPTNQALHFSSVLALHKGSGTLHVDDNLVLVGLAAGRRPQLPSHAALCVAAACRRRGRLSSLGGRAHGALRRSPTAMHSTFAQVAGRPTERYRARARGARAGVRDARRPHAPLWLSAARLKPQAASPVVALAHPARSLTNQPAHGSSCWWAWSKTTLCLGTHFTRFTTLKIARAQLAFSPAGR